MILVFLELLRHELFHSTFRCWVQGCGVLEPACTGSQRPVVHLSYQLCVQAHQVSLKSVKVWVFMPQKSANTRSQRFPHIEQGSPILLGHRPIPQYCYVPIRNQAARQEVSLNVMRLNHPQTIPQSTLVHGKIVFHENGPWYLKGWRLLP